jgi:hypothetical protein
VEKDGINKHKDILNNNRRETAEMFENEGQNRNGMMGNKSFQIVAKFKFAGDVVVRIMLIVK